MRSLHESIAKMLLNNIINESHSEVVRRLNAAAGPKIGDQAPSFKHGSGVSKEASSKPKHQSPVKDHYHHESEFDIDREGNEHHITVSHHADGTATVQHSTQTRKWSEKDKDYRESEKHRETHHKDLDSAISHVKTLHTPEK